MATIADALNYLYPGAKWTMTGDTYESIVWQDTTQKEPTVVEVLSEVARLSAMDPLVACKQKGQQLLQATDWVEIPSVTNTASVPYLTNAVDFLTYRSAVRSLAINPVESPVWPAMPAEEWSVVPAATTTTV
jgi:hypothetical protein